MVFIRDEGGVFDAPLAAVWEYVGSGDPHARAHGHRHRRRRRLAGPRGTYAWEQPFRGQPTRFTMRWTSLPPLGLAYEVLRGPFEGSKFFLFYAPRGDRTAVSVVGDFVSPTLPPPEVPAAVEEFFALEFEQDRAGLRERGRPVAGSRAPTRRSPRRRPSGGAGSRARS